MKRCTCLMMFLLAAPVAAQPLQFNRDVRPILSDACFQCHGPDKTKRKAKLGFDSEDAAREAIVPGKPGESELVKRITHADKSKRMPPVSAAVTLTQKQIDTLTEWIRQGAKWQKHWAFIPPERPRLPAVNNKAWPKNPIDYFVLARLEQEGLAPSPEADAVTLIRRMSLDLTGLPPTPAEVDEFATAWDAAGAKQRQILVEQLADRLLASPRYGERMARPWLDAARYADTNGYQNDGERVMWRWRDWVIDAFNSNMPFDQFTIEQIAGDLLPNATLEQKIATGFNRNHRGNSEGGVIPEEFAVEYVVDRVDTTATVWLGLTAGCARCHDHKYDPISQKEFYQLYAYFNSVPERGKAIKYGNSPPYIKSPTKAQQIKRKQLERQAVSARLDFLLVQADLDAAQRAWEQALDPRSAGMGDSKRNLVAHFPLDAPVPKADTHGKLAFVPGRRHEAIEFDGNSYLDVGDAGGFGFFDKFSMGAWIKPAAADAGTILSRMADNDRAEGYSLSVQNGKLHVQFVKRWLDDSIRIETVDSLPAGEWRHLLITYDGSRIAKGIQVYLDGKPANVKVNLDDINQNFATKEPLRIAAGGGRRFRGAIEDIRIFDDVIAPEDAAVVANVEPLAVLAAIPKERRTSVQARKLRTYFLENDAPREFRAAYTANLAAEKELEKFDASLPTTMVMQEMSPPRDAFILLRGEYDKPGAKVQRAVPAAFSPLAKDVPNNRLGFAKWLVARENPLTARVAVNRYWQMVFGTGIVKTVEDFGAQGDWPSHPELLDWLAVEFMEPASVPRTPSALRLNEKWDVKRFLKLIVSSAAYRQSARVTPALLQKDPDNRLLSRGPRARLSADIIRDQALFASGLLVEEIGGPSVRPYQPAGLAKELTGADDYVQDHGKSLYRRSLYTFWKRTIAPPTLMNFDAANRETCVVRESRTNTPLQALNLMNDVTFVEAARVLAQRVMKSEADANSRLGFGFRLAASRSPTDRELKVLRTAFDRHLDHYRANPAAAEKLIGVGEAPRDHKLDVAEHAAYTAVCNLILNLDEAITKE